MAFGTEKILKWIGSNSDQKSLIVRSVFFSMLIGVSQTFLIVVPLAIFLSKYSSSLLTYAYISMGIVAFVIGNIFKFFQTRLSFFKFLNAPLILFAVSVFVCWLLLMGTQFYWFPMALFVWTSVGYVFLSLVLENLVVRIFTLQEGKKFFGIVGGARASAGIITGFLIPLFVDLIGVNNIILLIPFALIASMIALASIYKNHQDRFTQESRPEEKNEDKQTFNKLHNKSYVVAIFALGIISLFNFLSLDILFNTEVKKYFINEEAITQFLGIFVACTNILILFGSFFLFGLLLKKIGLISTLLVNILVIVSLMSLALIVNFIPTSMNLVFGVFSFTILIERMLRQSVNGESLNLLYSPLRPEEKDWAQFQFRVIVQCICTSIIGGILLLVSHTLGIHISSICTLVLAVSICGLGFLSIVKKNYIKILTDSLSKWAIVQPELTKLDKKSLNVLKEHLKSSFPEEVIYVLQVIEDAEPEEFNSVIQEALDNSLADVRCYALDKIEQLRIQPATEKVKEICLNEKDPKVLSCAIRALGALTDIEQFPWFKEQLQNPDIKVAGSCFIAMVLYGSEVLKKEANDLLVQKGNSPEERDRLLAARVLRKIDIPAEGKLLASMLDDPSMEVRLEACKAAGNVHDERLYPPLIKSLKIPQLHYFASRGLLKLAPCDYIFKNFDHFSRGEQYQLLLLLGRMKPEQSQDFLQKFFNHPDRKLFHAAVSSLKNQSFKVAARDQIDPLLVSENQNILNLKEVIGALKGDKTKALRELLKRECELAQERCFRILTFVYPEDLILSALDGMRSSDKAKISNAVEILLETLSKEDSNLLVPQLTFQAETRQERESAIEKTLQKVLSYAPNCYISAINSAVIYTIGELGLKSMIDVVHKNEAKNDPFLAEIRPWTLKKLEV